MDGSDIKSDDSGISEVEKANKKQEKKEKRKAFFNKLGNAIKENVNISIK